MVPRSIKVYQVDQLILILTGQLKISGTCWIYRKSRGLAIRKVNGGRSIGMINITWQIREIPYATNYVFLPRPTNALVEISCIPGTYHPPVDKERDGRSECGGLQMSKIVMMEVSIGLGRRHR